MIFSTALIRSVIRATSDSRDALLGRAAEFRI